MKRILWNITLASVITLVAYIVLFFVWFAILSEVQNETLKLTLIALMTSIAFSFFLVYTSKIKGSVGDDEVISDYKERKYTSFLDDFKIIIRREFQTLICIALIVVICFVLNTFDEIVFGKKTISFPTFFFAPMCLFSSLINVPFVGYALSVVVDCVFYIVFLLIYRKKKYNYWMKNKT